MITGSHLASASGSPREVHGLAVLWSRTEPDRVGELALVLRDREPYAFGRAAHLESAPLELVRQRGATSTPSGPIRATGISRVQLLVRRQGRLLQIDNVGRRAMRHNGREAAGAIARVGDLIEIEDELLFLVVRRPIATIATRLPEPLVPTFGRADAFGVVGESHAAWELRRQLAFAACRDDHVLIGGPTGSGKELAARAIHKLSRRATDALIARNAATFPEGLIDAELFGNLRDFPNPGMPERAGLIGAADGGTLFLDEIGELPHALQAHPLRVMDAG